jgi:hypothetical protein
LATRATIDDRLKTARRPKAPRKALPEVEPDGDQAALPGLSVRMSMTAVPRIATTVSTTSPQN